MEGWGNHGNDQVAMEDTGAERLQVSKTSIFDEECKVR